MLCLHDGAVFVVIVFVVVGCAGGGGGGGGGGEVRFVIGWLLCGLLRSCG